MPVTPTSDITNVRSEDGLDEAYVETIAKDGDWGTEADTAVVGTTKARATILVDKTTGKEKGTATTPLVAQLAAGSDAVGQVLSPSDVLELTPTLETSAYADGDLLFDATELANFVRANGKTALIQSITVIDKDDQKVAFDIFSAYETVDFGTVNSAPTISDADAAKVQRVCRVESADYIDLGGVAVATLTNIGLMVEPASASRSMFFAGVTRGAPTYSASGLVIRFGVLWLS